MAGLSEDFAGWLRHIGRSNLERDGTLLIGWCCLWQKRKIFFRMNHGTQRSRVLEGLEILKYGMWRFNEIAAEHPCGIVTPDSYLCRA